MSVLAPHTLATAPKESRPALEQLQKGLGFIPNLYATFAESPALLKGVLAPTPSSPSPVRWCASGGG